MEKFKAVGDRLRNAGHSYLDSSIPPEDGEEAERLLQEQTAQVCWITLRTGEARTKLQGLAMVS